MKRVLLLGVIFCLLFQGFTTSVSAEPSVSFRDVVPGAWYYENVMAMAEKGYLQGSDGYFRPDDPITQAEFSLLLLRVSQGDNWYGGEYWQNYVIEEAFDSGWYDDKNQPDLSTMGNLPIDRISATVTLLRALREPCGDIWAFGAVFKDMEQIPQDCRDFVLAAYSKGMVGGDENGNFHPDGQLTRAQACALADRAFLHKGNRLTVPQPGGQTPSLKVKEVFAGIYGSYLLDENNTLWGVGDNTKGMLGIGDATCYEVFPVKIAENVAKVSSGLTHSFLLMTNGELWAWGSNTAGQLGLPADDTRYLKPVKVMDGIKDALALQDNSFLVKETGELWAYGTLSFQEGMMPADETVPQARKMMDGVRKIGFVLFPAQPGLAILLENGEVWEWSSVYLPSYMGLLPAPTHEVFQKRMDDMVDLDASISLFAKDGAGTLWTLTALDGFAQERLDAIDRLEISDIEKQELKNKVWYLPFELPNVRSVTAWLDSYLFIDWNYGLYYYDKYNSVNDAEGKGAKQHVKLLDQVGQVRLGMSQCLALKQDGTALQYGVVYGKKGSGYFRPVDWNYPQQIFLRK